MSDYQLQQKQKYLRQNILEKQYDAEQFMDFCQNFKGSVDIDSWSLKQLKNIVKRFIQQQQSKKDQFSTFQMSNQIQTPKNQGFDNWSNFVQHIPKVQEKKELGLNSIDLDFLQMMGMGTPTTNKKQQPKSKVIQSQKPAFTSISTNLQKPKPKNGDQELIKKLQDQNFISVFNNSLETSSPNKSNNSNINSNPFDAIQKQTQNNGLSTKSQQNSLQPQIDFKSLQNSTTADISAFNSGVSNVIKPERDYPSGPQQNFVQQVKCKQISKNRITNTENGNIFCNITEHQIINPNVFVPKFVLYTINTTPGNVEVKRRMKDFQQLRNLLKKLFPTTQIPHLQRYSRLSQTQPHVISKQKLYLQSFLNSLLMNPNLKCRILQDFLFCTDLDTFKKVSREFQKVQKPKSIQQLWSITGTVKLNTNTANRKYFNQQQLYVDYLQSNFTKLKTLYDQLTVYYQNTSKIMSQISQIYDQLQSTTKTVNLSFDQSLRFKTFQPMLGAVGHIHKQLSESLQTQAKIIHSEIKHMFKYQVQNLATLKQTMKILNNIYDTYQKRSDKDAAKKDVYESKKLIQYKTGAQNPSRNVTYIFYITLEFQNINRLMLKINLNKRLVGTWINHLKKQELSFKYSVPYRQVWQLIWIWYGDSFRNLFRDDKIKMKRIRINQPSIKEFARFNVKQN